MAVYTWNDMLSLGSANGRGAPLIPLSFLHLAGGWLGLSPVVTQKFFLYFLFLSAGLSMYYLTWVLKLPRLARLTATLFYMMNPLNIMGFIPVSSLTVGPFILGAYIQGLRQNRGLGFIIVFVCIWTLATSYSYTNPAWFFIHWGILITYLVYYCAVVARSRSQILDALKFTGLLIVIFLFLNLFWMMPMISTASTSVAQARVSGKGSLTGYVATPIEAIRLLGGAVVLASQYKGDPICSWASHYLFSIPMIMIEMLIPIIACLFVFSRDRRRKIDLLFFLALLLMAIFLAKGASPPFGNITLWAFNRVPYLAAIFRFPQKFGELVPFSYAPMLGMGIYLIYNFVVRRFRKVWLNICVLLIFSSTFVFYSLPFWTGELFHPGGQVIPSTRIQIPDYYASAREWLHEGSDEGIRVYPLPATTSYDMAFKWEYGYHGLHPDAFLLDIGSVAYNPDFDKVPFIVGQKIEEGYDGDLTRMLSLMQVKYVIFHRDTDWDYIAGNGRYFDMDPERIESFFDGQENIHFQRSFGLLDFYKISDEYFLPYIYPSTTPTLVSGDVEAITSLTETKYLDGKPALFFNSQIENKGLEKRKDISKLVFSHNKWKLLEPASRIKDPGSRIGPEITFQKINPTKYRVKVKNATEPFWLVFSESFHPQWRAYIEQRAGGKVGRWESEKVSRERRVGSGEIVAEYPRLGVKEGRHLQKFTPGDIKYLFRKADIKEHYLVNGYANAWYVNVSPSVRQTVGPPGKEMEIVLYFWPQSLFYLGLGISGLTLLGCIGYLVGAGIRRRKRRAKSTP